MYGRITYTTTQVTPFSLLMVGNVLDISNVIADELPVGATQDIFLKWGYSHFDPYHTDKRNVSQSASGVVEVTNFLSTLGYRFGCENVVQDRDFAASEYAIIEALNYELVDGTPIRWYPDWTYSTTEYYSCIAAKRLDQKRMGSHLRWKFEFDLMVLANVQIPSTVPSFVV